MHALVKACGGGKSAQRIREVGQSYGLALGTLLARVH
jgi:hypothetical protein